MSGVVHVIRPGLPSLRRREEIEVLRAALRAGNERPGFRVVAFSAMSNHLHYAVEVRSTTQLSIAMQGLAIRMAKALNRLWGRSGSVFLERFHARLAEGFGAIRRVMVYVLNNARKHGVRLAHGVPDPYSRIGSSSGPWFRHWRTARGPSPPEPPREPSPVAEVGDPNLSLMLMGFGVAVDDVPADRRRAVPLDAW